MTNVRNNIKVFVSSTVYDFETQLSRVYAILDGFGYDVYMSKEGTIPLDSNLNAFDNCVQGVDDCDVFVGFIRPLLGTGIYDKNQPSVTELEFKKAFDKGMLRFVLADFKVEFAHQYLNLLGHDINDIPTYKEKSEMDSNGNSIKIRVPNKIVHPQCVSLYRKAIQANIKDYNKRKGNWVQPYKDVEDIIRHIEAQFRDVQRVKDLLP